MKRVQRDFIDTLWEESQQVDEHEWKSAARRRMVVFEEQLHQGGESGEVLALPPSRGSRRVLLLRPESLEPE